MRYVIPDSSWSPDDDNPFSTDGSYGSQWSCFSLAGGTSATFFTGRSTAGCWLARFGTGVPDVAQRFADFALYENNQGRTVILQLPPGIDPAAFLRDAETTAPEPTELRPSDPAYVVHSTTTEGWRRIQSDGQLRAGSLIGSSFGPTAPPTNEVEAYIRNEPPEYKDYVMFGEVGSATPEVILASFAAGRFVLDADVPYSPGVRLYFDNRKIVADGRCTRDGIHTTKVFRTLPLQGYLLLSVGTADLRQCGDTTSWTPRTFAQAADQLFLAHLSKAENV